MGFVDDALNSLPNLVMHDAMLTSTPFIVQQELVSNQNVEIEVCPPVYNG